MPLPAPTRRGHAQGDLCRNWPLYAPSTTIRCGDWWESQGPTGAAKHEALPADLLDDLQANGLFVDLPRMEGQMSDPASRRNANSTPEEFSSHSLGHLCRFASSACCAGRCCCASDRMDRHAPVSWRNRGGATRKTWVAYEAGPAIEPTSIHPQRGWCRNPGRTAIDCRVGVMKWVFLKTAAGSGCRNASAQASGRQPRSDREFPVLPEPKVYVTWKAIDRGGRTRVAGVPRAPAGVLCLMLPCPHGGFTGLVDGWVRRDIRRFGRGARIPASSYQPRQGGL